MSYDNYCLNLVILKLEPKDIQDRIHDYYKDMLLYNHENRGEIAKSYFNTLNIGGYLIDIRDEKIKSVLNGDNSIGS